MPKKINLTNTKQKLKRNAPWIVAGASVGISLAYFGYTNSKTLLEVPKNAHQYMIESERAMIYTTKFGDFSLTALPNGAINL